MIMRYTLTGYGGDGEMNGVHHSSKMGANQSKESTDGNKKRRDCEQKCEHNLSSIKLAKSRQHRETGLERTGQKREDDKNQTRAEEGTKYDNRQVSNHEVRRPSPLTMPLTNFIDVDRQRHPWNAPRHCLFLAMASILSPRSGREL